MYKCAKCKRQTKPGESCNVVVTETRPKIYIRSVPKGFGETKYLKEIKSEGWEIARSRLECNDCCQKAVDTMLNKIGAVKVNE